MVLLRLVKQKVVNAKDIPALVQNHINFHKIVHLRQTPTFYHYHEELLWRTGFLEQILEVLEIIDIIEVMPVNIIAEWLNGLLSYLHRLSTINPKIIEDLKGKRI